MADRALLFDSGKVLGQGAGYPEQCINIYKVECHNYNTEKGRMPTQITYVVMGGIVWVFSTLCWNFTSIRTSLKKEKKKKKNCLDR